MTTPLTASVAFFVILVLVASTQAAFQQPVAGVTEDSVWMFNPEVDATAANLMADSTRLSTSRDQDWLNVVPIPDPSAILLLALGGMAIVGRRPRLRTRQWS